MISKYVINNSFFSVGKASLKGGRKRGKNRVIPSVRTAPGKRSLSLSSLRGTIQVFLRIFLACLDPAEHPIKGVGTQRVALDKARMRLRVKPAKTQIVSHLRMMRKYAAKKLCKKVAFSLRKPTALFRKMGTRIFFLEQPLVIRKIRVPLCSNVRNLFVEQSAHSQFPDKTDYQAFTRIVPRGTFCALRHEMCKNRRF